MLPGLRWHAVWHPGSDALCYNDLPPERCAAGELTAVPAGSIDWLLSTLASAVKMDEAMNKPLVAIR